MVLIHCTVYWYMYFHTHTFTYVLLYLHVQNVLVGILIRSTCVHSPL